MSPTGTLLLDDDGRIMALNDLAARLLGVDRDAGTGRSFVSCVESESARRIEEHLGDAAVSGRPERCEIEVTDDDGRTRNVLVMSIADASDAESVALRVTLVDISSYVEKVDCAEGGRRAAERVARSKTDFLARLSHEIRSALASMIGFADILHNDVPDENKELTEIIRDSGRHILDTLNSVMDLARLEFQQGEIELSEVDVVGRIRDRITIFRKLASARGLELVFRDESQTAVALLNETFLDRIIHNLVDNAIKYTPEGKVEVSVEERDGSVWIYVADTGVGIREEFLPRLFSPFEREKRDAQIVADGVGLGLAITKYLVELMKGRIVACSTQGQGSTFTVSFPALEPPSTTEAA